MRYIDPSGHFSEDEIHRYLRYRCGIESDLENVDAFERQTIIENWRADIAWWRIIRCATYGDILDGAILLNVPTSLLDNQMSLPMSHIIGVFKKDDPHDTFYFDGEERVLDTFLAGSWSRRNYDCLKGFYEHAEDILWIRQDPNGTLRYMGGTGQAENAASLLAGKKRAFRNWLLSYGAIGAGLYDMAESALTMNPLTLTKGIFAAKGGDIASREYMEEYIRFTHVEGVLHGLNVRVE
jgi:hypothetical protein